jgi:hypothetical protein
MHSSKRIRGGGRGQGGWLGEEGAPAQGGNARPPEIRDARHMELGPASAVVKLELAPSKLESAPAESNWRAHGEERPGELVAGVARPARSVERSVLPSVSAAGYRGQ